ncbi:MAG: putative membrane protein [Flavobacterium sp.]|jgi:uncharacterized membrane protein
MIYINQLLEIPLFSGIVFLIVGVIMYLFPPKKPNIFYGYRTTRSMNSLQAWQFSQKYAAAKMIQVSIALLIISLAGNWYTFTEISTNIVGTCILISVIFYLIVSTELALKTKYPNKKL